MKPSAGVLVIAVIFLSTSQARQALLTRPPDQAPPADQARPADGEKRDIPLNVPAGAPLRIYLTQRISKRAGASLQAKTIEPVFAFDREVVPAGSVVAGKVSRTIPISKWRRFQSILNGDFTPLHDAIIQLDTLTLPDGSTRAIRTDDAPTLTSIYAEPSNKPKKNPKAQPKGSSPQDQNGGILGTAKQSAKDRINSTISARTYGVADIVRAPNKKEKLIDFLWAKLPWRPQYLRRGTRVDAPLSEPLLFGTESVRAADLGSLGLQPAPDTVGRMRLLAPLDSESAKVGEPMRAVVSAPLFSADHKLALPEGTVLTGTVTVARKARSFHRGGQLRFRFDNVELPAEVASLRPPAPAETPAALRTQATLDAAEGSGTAPIKVDSEGGVQAQESKTRFIAPVISLMLASRAADNDAGRNHSAAGTGGETNVSGRTLGGISGFGLVGAAVSQRSKYVGMAFGYYGLAWSVYTAVVAKGGEVQFDRNAMLDVRFGARPAAPEKTKASAGATAK